MSEVAALVRQLIAAGTPPDVAAEIVARAFVAGSAATVPARSKHAEAQARYDAKRKAAKASELISTDQNDHLIRDDEAPSKVPPTPPLNTPQGSDPNGSGAKAAPVYTDSRHELWGEGIPILGQLGVSDSAARGNIGRWLKASRDDAATVLSAIQRARDQRVLNPIPWITQALRTDGGNGKRFGGGTARGGTGDFLAGLASLARPGPGDRGMAGPEAEEIPRGRINIDG